MVRLGRPTYAGVTATIALLVALGGTSVAAVSLGKATVGTAQLKNGAVTPPNFMDLLSLVTR